MLLELYIKNFTIIEEVRIKFDEGFNVITGETGAGKSVVLDAINLIMGERASSEYIKSGKDKAYIECVFKCNSKDVLRKLEEWGIEQNEGILIISRELSTRGRNICRINGNNVTVSMLNELSSHLVEMHGQHEHQTLLNPDNHLKFLDLLGDEELINLKHQVFSAYKKYSDSVKRLKQLEEKEKDRAKRLDFIKYQIDEIEKAKLQEEEDIQLENEKKKVENAEKIFNLTAENYNLLYDSSEHPCVIDLLSRVIKNLEHLTDFDTCFIEMLNDLREALYKIEECSYRLRDYLESIEFDPKRLDEIQIRLNAINQLKRKYGESVSEILNTLKELKKEHQKLIRFNIDYKDLQHNINKLQIELIECAKTLSIKRKKVAKILENKVVKELKELGMKNSKFRVGFSMIDDKDGIEVDKNNIKIDGDGFDVVEFLISTNPGEPLKPLAKIVSGGELSRIMLALKTVLAKAYLIPTLVFDEIDTGIGGKTAHAVSQKLSEISKNHQVICVTHLAQIACRGNNHLFIEKTMSRNKTSIKIKKLNYKERIRELARMIDGTLTQASINTATQLLKKAK